MSAQENGSENKTKARLIAKRIAALIAEGTILGRRWADLTPETRNNVVSTFDAIAKEVLGEEAEPISDEAMLKLVCERVQPGMVIRYAMQKWANTHGEDAVPVIGPRRDMVVECGCIDGECTWCCGTGKVTSRVKQAKEEAGRPKEEPKPDRPDWSDFVWRSGWTDSFVERMREKGAVRIEVPASQSGSVVVEFDKRIPPPVRGVKE